MVLASVQSQYNQGVYGLVGNLGSLLVRTLFQPLEEIAFAAFSRCGLVECGIGPNLSLAQWCFNSVICLVFLWRNQACTNSGSKSRSMSQLKTSKGPNQRTPPSSSWGSSLSLSKLFACWVFYQLHSAPPTPTLSFASCTGCDGARQRPLPSSHAIQPTSCCCLSMVRCCKRLDIIQHE